MMLEVIILALGLYLGVYLTQQLSAGLPEMPGPATAAQIFLLSLYRRVADLLREKPPPPTLTGEIPADQMPRDPPIELVLAEQLASDVM